MTDEFWKEKCVVRAKGRPSQTWSDDIKQWASLDQYEALKRRAEDHDIRRNMKQQFSASEHDM